MEKMRKLKHLYVTVYLYNLASFMVVPAITDVTMLAICPGLDTCSLAIYLSGFQQAIIGVGTVVMTPLIGNLSDEYGRKALLTLPMTLAIIPLVILAYSRTESFFYTYYAFKIITAMLSDGSVQCLSIAYVADYVSESERASAFGILSGVGSAAFVCGTVVARFLSTSSTFQVAAFVSMLAALYMRIFLKESAAFDVDDSIQPILKEGHTDSSKKIQLFKKIPSLHDLLCLLNTSVIFSQAATVALFSSLADGGMFACLLYFLRARFQFSKDQFAGTMLIVGVSQTISQLILMPILLPAMGEAKLLSIGLFVSFITMVLYSIAWAAWVPYALAAFTMLSTFTLPCIRSIASKQVGPNEQGKAQGCISGITSFAMAISPLIFSPLTALFLSEGAPFNFPGFSIMCIGFTSLIAFIPSTMIRVVPHTSSHEADSLNHAPA